MPQQDEKFEHTVDRSVLAVKKPQKFVKTFRIFRRVVTFRKIMTFEKKRATTKIFMLIRQ